METARKMKRRVRQCPVCLELAAVLALVSGKYDSSKMMEAMDMYAGDRKGVVRFRLMEDILYSWRRYRVVPSDYFKYGFMGKDHAARSAYVCAQERQQLVARLHRGDERWRLLKDKYQTYVAYRPFFGRDAIQVRGEEDLPAFLAFVHEHPEFVAKPLDATHGDGVRLVNLSEASADARTFFSEELHGGYILEEQIVQDPRMAALHPDSVNTLRVVTCLVDGEVVIVFAMLRMGRGGSFVDNAGAGGIVAAVDVDTGIIASDGRCYGDLRTYKTHPDSGVALKGRQLPCWKALIDLTEEAARTIPEIPWIGWDFALSDKGWVVVEANQSPDFKGIQMCLGRGLRPEIENSLMRILP